MTPTQHADEYLSKLRGRQGIFDCDIDDETQEEIVNECRKAFEDCAKDAVLNYCNIQP